MKGKTLIRTLVAGTAVIGLTMTGSTPANAEPDRPQRPTDAASAALFAAIQRDLGLTREQAVRRFDQQEAAIKLAAELTPRLSDEFAGSWFDAGSGKLMVAVTTTGRAEQARAAGAEATVVRHSLATLNAIQAELDAEQRRDRERMADATSWGIDPQRNAVVVTVRKGRTGPALSDLVARRGDAVRVEETDTVPQPAADFLDGGDPFNDCSVGFNVHRNGVGYFLTAGHCGSVGTVARSKGVDIGPFEQSFYPGDDDALVRNDNPGFWAQGPWISAYDPGDNVFNVSGHEPMFLANVVVCKSGRTTKITCGVITGVNETVNYGDGPVHQLSRHSACLEKGDSGGANYTPHNGGRYFAAGMSSGAELISDGTRLRCRSAIVPSAENRSWFQPVEESLSFYGVSLYTI